MKTLQQKKVSAASTTRKKNKGGKPKNAGQLRLNEKNVQDTVLKIVNSQIGNLFNADADSDSDDEVVVNTPAKATPAPQQKTYKSQVVILDGVSDS